MRVVLRGCDERVCDVGLCFRVHADGHNSLSRVRGYGSILVCKVHQNLCEGLTIDGTRW